MLRSPLTWLAGFVGFILLLTVSGAFYILPETEQAILTQFGQPIGGPIKDAGLHFKIPFVQVVNRIDKRVLDWDGLVIQMPTKDKLYIVVDSFAQWRITEPLQYFLRLHDEHSANSRLNDIIGSEMRNTVARHQLTELVRSTKDRKPIIDEVVASTASPAANILPAIEYGRLALEKEVTDQSRQKLAEFGIDLIDVRFMRINYNSAVATKIIDRMISERRQIAERFRSEGAGEAAKILGTRERDIRQIESESYRQAQVLQGKADAEATAIYAEAYNQNPQAREYYEFTRALETYKTAFSRETTLVLTTENGFLRHLKGETRPGDPLPAALAPSQPPMKAASPPPPPAEAAPAAPAAPSVAP